MKKKFILFTIILTTIISLEYSSGPASTVGQGYTGAPGETGTVCGSCHTGGSYGTSTANLSVTSGGAPVTTYVGGETYQVSLTAVPGGGAPAAYGFQLTVLDASDNDVADFSNPSSNAKISIAASIAGGRTYAEHNGPSDTSAVFTFDWVAPASATGDLTFYYAVNAVNLNGQTNGDNGSLGFSTAMSETPVPKVKVIGALEVNNAFTFPTSDGTANQVLTTDGAGVVTWQDNAAFTGGSTTSEDFRTSQNQNHEIKLQKVEIDNLKNEVVYLKSEIEAMKKLIDRLTRKINN